MTAIDVDHLRRWIGRTERQEDVVTAARVAEVAATLDRPAAPSVGDPLPALWHWAFFTPKAPLATLSQDGHPKLGGFMPPIPLPRRMWVGGRLRFLAPLRVGDRAVRTTEVRDVSAKTGSSGALVFLTLRHEIATGDGPAIVEEQDLVYRERATGTARPAAPAAPTELPPADWRDGLLPGPVQLFRYSAVTFNAHRIHYDWPYATQVEGYPGLLVHGPLLVLAQVQTHRLSGGAPIASLRHRCISPLFCGQPAVIRSADTEAGVALTVAGPNGICASVELTTKEPGA